MADFSAGTVVSAFVVVPYLAGFAMALPVRSWRSHVPASAAAFVVVGGLVWLLSRMSLYPGVVLSLPIAGLVVGLATGLVTRAIVLAARWPIRSLRAAAATLIGLAVPLLGWEAWRSLREWEGRTALARLPDAETLPRIAACERFRTHGPLYDAVLEAAHGDPPGGLPQADRALRFPAAHRHSEWARVEHNGYRGRYIDFAMHVADGSPIPLEDRRIGFNGRDGVDPKQPFIVFNLTDRVPIERHLERTFADGLVKAGEGNRPPQIVRTPISRADLDEITSIPPRVGHDREEVFATHGEGPVTDLLICSKVGSVPKPTCRFALDQGGLAVGGNFRRTDLARWPEIADHVRRFVDCALAAGDAAAAKPAGGE